MRVQRKEIEKLNNRSVSYSITNISEIEFKILCKALDLMPEEEPAAEMLHKLKGIAAD